MNKKLYYAVIAMVLITSRRYFRGMVKIGRKKKQVEPRLPEKQLVKPDDIIEEAIIGDDSQEVVEMKPL